jgi:hypothetical protein
LCGRLIADGKIELASGRSAGRPQARPAADAAAAVGANRYMSRATGVLFQAAPAVPAAPPAPPAVPPAAPPAPARDRSRSPRREDEGRRVERSVIAARLQRQWRNLNMADRPLPGPNRADSGVIGYGSWSDGLVGEVTWMFVSLNGVLFSVG